MLARWLAGEDLAYMDQSRCEAALRHPWGWPADETLARRVESCGISPEAPRPGDALLLAVGTRPEQTQTLWRLTRHQSRREDGLVGTAAAALHRACAIATHDLPFLVRPVAGLHDGWSARCLLTAGVGEPSHLDGDSVGFSMVLAAASWLMDEALPPDLVASVALAPDGTARRVDGLAAKLRLVEAFALGIRRFLVAAEQKEEADSLAGGRVEILPVAHLADALAIAFPGMLDVPPRQWPSTEALRLADHLYHLALWNRHPVLGWSCVARPARWLIDQHGDLAALRRKAAFARDVAERHEGKPRPLDLPEPQELAALPRMERLAYLAHVVQSQGDAGADEALTIALAVAASVAEARECCEYGLRLRGAIGRVLGTWQPLEPSTATWLRETVQAWLGTATPEAASHALCEWLRVLGVAGRGDELDHGLETMLEIVALPAVSAASRAFLHLASGRALVQTRQAARALAKLQDPAIDWDLAPRHVSLARCRWLARAHALQGSQDHADRLRAALKHEEDTASDLAALDAALEAGLTGVRLQTAVQAVLEQDRPMVQRLLADVGPDVVRQARRVADWYPY